MATDASEQGALAGSYSIAINRSTKKGTSKQILELEALVDSEVRLITACGLEKAHSLTERADSVFTVFRNMVAAGLRFTGDDRNNTDRIVAEDATFPTCSTQIHYAALALTDDGLENYGTFFLIWDLAHVAHRTTLLIGNCLTTRRSLGVKLSDALPLGSRSTWDDRCKLVVTKLEPAVTPSSDSSAFPSLLLRQGLTSDEDEFIEAHIFGPLSRGSLLRVVRNKLEAVPIPNDLIEKAYFIAMVKRLERNVAAAGIGYEDRT
jgi:hypothetical protein